MRDAKHPCAELRANRPVFPRPPRLPFAPAARFTGGIWSPPPAGNKFMEDIIRAEGKLLVASWARFCFGSSRALRARRPVDTLQSTRIGCGGLFLRKSPRTPVVTRTPQSLWLRPNSQGRQGLGIAGHGAQDELVGVRGVLELVSPEMPPARLSSFADVNGHGSSEFSAIAPPTQGRKQYRP